MLVVTDNFSWYAQAFPTKNQKAITVAKVLCEKYFVHYGLPARIHSDQGTDFESRLIKEILSMLGVRKSHTTPYHPQGDPQPERFNRTLLSMLGTLDPSKKQKWSQYISHLVHAYNCTKNDATGFSPYFLMFGREARLPVDICFGTSPDGETEIQYQKYVSEMRRELKKAYELASDAANMSHLKNKTRYDRWVLNQSLEEGDRVLLRNVGITGKHKLQDRWKSVPYVIVEKLPNIPVYRVKPERGAGVIKTLHRDHLLPIGYLVRMSTSVEKDSVAEKPVTRAQTAQKQVRKRESGLSRSDDEPESMDSEDEYDYQTHCFNLDKFQTEGREASAPQENILSLVDGAIEEGESSSHQESEDLEETTFLEHSDIEVTHPLPDTVVDIDLERGDVLDSSASVEDGEASGSRISRRAVKPVIRLTYDEPGKPSDRPFTIIHRGMMIQISGYSDFQENLKKSQRTHAVCAVCAKQTNLAHKN